MLGLEDVLGIDEVVSPIVSNVCAILVSSHCFAHVVGILAIRSRIIDVLAVVVLDNAVHTVTHALIESDSLGIALPYEEVNEPGILFVGSSLKLLRKEGTEAQATGFGSDSESSDVCMPWQIVIRKLEVVRGTLNLAHDCAGLSKPSRLGV